MDNKQLLRYSKLDQEPGSNDSEAFLSDSENPRSIVRHRSGFIRSSLLCISLVVSWILAALVGAYASRHWALNGDAYCAQKTTRYSPIVKEVDINYHLTSFNGSLLKENIYRKDASPEVDAAWEALGVNYRSVVIPEAEAEKSGLSPKQVKINPKHGGGYPAQIEGFHQLHCLNLLRQGLYYNFEYYHALQKGAFKNDDHILRVHITHCLDILRQQLMCTVDTSVFGQVWVNPETPFAYVDFNAKDHVCKNFEDIRQWVEVRQIPEEVPKDFLEFPGDNTQIYGEVP